jgi:hypothetical protein
MFWRYWKKAFVNVKDQDTTNFSSFSVGLVWKVNFGVVCLISGYLIYKIGTII